MLDVEIVDNHLGVTLSDGTAILVPLVEVLKLQTHRYFVLQDDATEEAELEPTR